MMESTKLVDTGIVGDLHDPQGTFLHRLADGIQPCDGAVLRAELLQEQLHVVVVVMAEVLRLDCNPGVLLFICCFVDTGAAAAVCAAVHRGFTGGLWD